MARPAGAGEVFRAFLRLGTTSFGGPIAHLGYFREEFVARRRWLDDADYAELVALCQLLPGPASSQVGLAIGLRRAGWRGAVAAWCGFTAPSAALMLLFAFGLLGAGDAVPAGALRGLELAALAVVALAVQAMARAFCRPAWTWPVPAVAIALALAVPHAAGQLLALACGALAGGLRAAPVAVAGSPPVLRDTGTAAPRTAGAALVAFALLLVALPLAAAFLPGSALDVVAVFYRAGALVFGGGHVVLPLLETGVVGPGWLAADRFVAGYGAAQAVPGPLFTFAAFLGASIGAGPGGVAGGLLALSAIFLPSFLLVAGVLPFWERIRARPRMRAALAGINAAVVGLLAAALYDPLWTTAVRGPADVALALAACLALAARVPPWLLVPAMAAVGALSPA